MNRVENSLHVVKALNVGPAAILDGFTVKGGMAIDAGVSGGDEGGGIQIVASSPTINNCVFENNDAVRGADMYVEQGGSPVVSNTTFTADPDIGFNSGIQIFQGDLSCTDCVVSDYRWGMLQQSGVTTQTVNLVRSQFLNNEIGAQTQGLAVNLIDCLFEGNTDVAVVGGNAGIPFNIAGSTFNNNGRNVSANNANITVSRSTFTGNNGTGSGGGIWMSNVNGSVVSSDFIGNTAAADGGALFMGGTSTISIVSSRFLGNMAGGDGGAIRGDGAGVSIVLVNSEVAANSATLGGGVAVDAGATFVAIQSTFNLNVAATSGGALHADAAASTLDNCVLWDNGDEIDDVTGTVTVNDSCIQGGWTGSGTGSSAEDPLFPSPLGADATAGTGDEDLSLGVGSTCIDTGDNSRLPADTHDLDGDMDTTEVLPFDINDTSRLNGAAVDPGAHESP